jgi:hypothetical protein
MHILGPIILGTLALVIVTATVFITIVLWQIVRKGPGNQQ